MTRLHTALAALLVAAALFLLAACSSSKTAPRGDVPPSGPLATVTVDEGSSVYVQVRGTDKSSCADMAGLVTAALQSDLGLSPAESAEEAATVVDVEIRDLYLALSEEGHVSATNTVGTAAVGSVAGLGIGGAAGGRSGAVIGAGIGAALGIGASVFDASNENTWALVADVAIGPSGNLPAPQTISVTSSGRNLSRTNCLTGLQEQLAQQIAGALRTR